MIKGKVMLNTTNKGSIFIILLLFMGCQNDENLIKEKSSKSELTEKEATAKQDKNDTSSLLNELGLSFEQDKIIIDINKTGHFFETLEGNFEDKIANVDLNITRDAGVIISDDEVSVDLNKTKKLLDNVSSFFETLINDINRSIGL